MIRHKTFKTEKEFADWQTKSSPTIQSVSLVKVGSNNSVVKTHGSGVVDRVIKNHHQISVFYRGSKTTYFNTLLETIAREIEEVCDGIDIDEIKEIIFKHKRVE